MSGMLMGPSVTPAAQSYEGNAYARASVGQLLYRETHYIYALKDAPRQLVLYRCPDGNVFARKLLIDSPTSASPDFDFSDSRTGYREGVRSEHGTRLVYVQQNANAEMTSKPLPAAGDAVIDAGFDTYVKMHWDELATRTARIAFLLPSRLGYLPVRLSENTDSVENGQPVRQLRMRIDSWYGFAAPAIELSYSTTDRRLRRFQGIGTIRTLDGRNQEVRIEFPDEPASEIPQASIDSALAEPLDGHCDG